MATEHFGAAAGHLCGGRRLLLEGAEPGEHMVTIDGGDRRHVLIRGIAYREARLAGCRPVHDCATIAGSRLASAAARSRMSSTKRSKKAFRSKVRSSM